MRVIFTTTSFSNFNSKLGCVSQVSECTVRDYLGELAQLGIASSAEHNRGKGGGKYKEHRLELSVSAIRSGLSTLLESA